MAFTHIDVFLISSITGLLAVGGNAETVQASPQVLSRSSDATAAVSESRISESKIQVYGQSPQPNQLRKGYVVFQQHEDQIIGAYYQPRSEFSCFVGDLERQKLDIDFLSPQGETLNGALIPLSKLHNLESPSSNDKRILNICRQQTL